MAWLVGIDEAGYGPNLGPLVMTAVAWHVPDRPPHQRTRLQIAHEADEVADVRVGEVQRKRIALGAGVAVVVADGLDGQHRHDAVAA